MKLEGKVVIVAADCPGFHPLGFHPLGGLLSRETERMETTRSRTPTTRKVIANPLLSIKYLCSGANSKALVPMPVITSPTAKPGLSGNHFLATGMVQA